MQKHLSKSQFKTKALELFRQVETSGESIIVTNHGVPCIEVRRHRSNESSPLEILKGSVMMYIKPTQPIDDLSWGAAKDS